MATAKAVWGIDIGQCAIKALKLRPGDDGVVVETFDLVEHPQILSEEDADKNLLIRAGLDQLAGRNDFKGAKVCISVPGLASFTRFVKLPPVDTKKIPEIVRFEAEQQIPFPIEEVVWRYQTFADPDSPDVEVGLFAMKRTDIQETLSYFEEVGIEVDVVQMAPLALYNFMTYDGQAPEGEATILADVGADKTDLVVADGPRIWTRTIQIGGNNFTEALVRAFKLSFRKAEALKRSAATSKYARQIFQSMRPVFSDLVQEIQRSIGHYTSLHRETRFKRMVGLGSGFKLPGLQKFLEQNLNMTVVRVDTVNKAQSPETNAALFSENVLGAAVVYGLAAQGLGLTRIQSNLLPEEIETKRRWAAKKPWFAAAAAVVLAALTAMPYRAFSDKRVLAGDQDAVRAKREVDDVDRVHGRYQELKDQGRTEQKKLADERDLYRYRTFWPEVQNLIRRVMGALEADEKGTPGGHARLLGDYAQALKTKLELERTIEDMAAVMASNSAAPLQKEEAEKKHKAATEQMKEAGAALRSILMAGSPPSRMTEYMDLEAKLEKFDQELQKPITDAEFQKTWGDRVETRKKLDDLVADSFSRLQIFRVDAIRTEYVADVTLRSAEEEVLKASKSARPGGGGFVPAGGDIGMGPRGGGPAGGGQPAAARMGKGIPGYVVTLWGTTAMPRDKAEARLKEVVKPRSVELAKNLPLVGWQGVETVAVGEAPGAVRAGAGAGGGAFGGDVRGGVVPQEAPLKKPDPLILRREAAGDTEFWIVWVFQIKAPEVKSGPESGM